MVQTASTQATLEKIGFTVAQAKSLAGANVTVIDLVAAVLTHEHRGLTTAEDSSAIQAAVIAVVNRTLDSAYMKSNWWAVRYEDQKEEGYEWIGSACRWAEERFGWGK